MHIHEQEERDSYDGYAYIQYLRGKLAAFEGAPVAGEEGWTQELEDEKQAIRDQLDGK